MWVSKDKWEKLVRRVDDLESSQRDSRYARNFTVYPNSSVPPDPIPKGQNFVYYNLTPYYGPSQDISVKDVVEKILRHLGIKLRYDAGQPARVQIEMPEKKA